MQQERCAGNGGMILNIRQPNSLIPRYSNHPIYNPPTKKRMADAMQPKQSICHMI